MIETVPADPEAWLSDVLGTHVRAVEVQPLGAGTAFLGRLTRLVVDHDDPGLPHRFILKAFIPLGFALLLLYSLAEAIHACLALLTGKDRARTAR